MDTLNSNSEKFLLIGDFNSEDHDIEISSFLSNHEASRALIFFITNSLKSSQHTHSFPCGLSYHRNLVFTVLKNTFGKQKSNIRHYRDWGKFDNAIFRTELREALISVERHEYKCFEQTFLSLLNFHAPMEVKTGVQIINPTWPKLYAK